MEKPLLLKLVALFTATQALGLFVAFDLAQKISSGELEQPSIVTENPEDIENAIGLIAYILVFTIIILIAIKFIKGLLLFKILESIAIFASALIVFSTFIPETAGAFAILFVVLRNALRESIWIRNASSVIAVAGAGAVIGISLGVVPVVVFIVLLAIYDIIAVFGTKHMVVMAKHLAKGNLAFTYALPSKKHQFELGTGDMVIPLTLSASVLRENIALASPGNFVTPVLILIGSLIGLIATLEYSNRNIGTALPALPPQTIIMLGMLALGKFMGY